MHHLNIIISSLTRFRFFSSKFCFTFSRVPRLEPGMSTQIVWSISGVVCHYKIMFLVYVSIIDSPCYSLQYLVDKALYTIFFQHKVSLSLLLSARDQTQSSCKQGKCSTPELYPQPHKMFFYCLFIFVIVEPGIKRRVLDMQGKCCS